MTPNRLFITSSLVTALLGMATNASAQNAPEPAAAPPPAEGAPPAAAPTAPPPVTTAAAPPAGHVKDQPGVSLSARLAYAVPMGSTAQGANLSTDISGGLPIVIEGTYRITPNISAGLFAQYGYLLTKNCDYGASCSATDYRFGLEGLYDLRMEGVIDPWLGLAVGYEYLSLDETLGGQSMSGSLTGFEYATLQAGGNFAATPQIDVGPFVSFSLGKFTSASAAGVSGDITNTAFHQWLQIGVRGTFNL
jgi:hypothetical protein